MTSSLRRINVEIENCDDSETAVEELKRLKREREMLLKQLAVAKERLEGSFAKVREYLDKKKREREEEKEEEENDEEEEFKKKQILRDLREDDDEEGEIQMDLDD